MNNKVKIGLGVLVGVGIGAGIVVWKIGRAVWQGFKEGFKEGLEKELNETSEPENPKPEDLKPDNETAEQLFKEVVEKELEEGEWKNERDFLSRITKEFIKEAKSIDWIDSFPVCLEDMMTRLSEIGLEDRFEKELEKKYMKGEK